MFVLSHAVPVLLLLFEPARIINIDSGAKRAMTAWPAPWFVRWVPLNTCRIPKVVALCTGSYYTSAAFYVSCKVQTGLTRPRHFSRIFNISAAFCRRFRAGALAYHHNQQQIKGSRRLLGASEHFHACFSGRHTQYLWMPVVVPRHNADNIVPLRIFNLKPASIVVAFLGLHDVIIINYGRTPVG
jgi:hypothetical protein